MTETAERPDQLWRGSVPVAYALFVLGGLTSGMNAPLLLAQMADYGVGRATIGVTFFSAAVGFVVAGGTSGPLIHRFGTRVTLIVGGLASLLTGVLLATRPTFAIFALLPLLSGYGVGLTESVANAHLAARPGATTLLNRLHAFFGVGALLGPITAAAMLRITQWPVVVLVAALVAVPAIVAVGLTFPDRIADPLSGRRESTVEAKGPGLLSAVLRMPGVLLAATMLSVYVGVEIGLGNWAYGYLVESRGVSDLIAGWMGSAFWGGLTLGRFVISPIATRLGLSTVRMAYACLVGVVAAAALTWLVPFAAVAVLGFVLLGFFLGPVFPTTMAVAPRLTEPRLAPTAIGVMNAGSVIGGAALPWLAGALGQGIGVWTLLPWTLLLALAQLLVWWRMVGHVNTSRPAGAEQGAPVPGYI